MVEIFSGIQGEGLHVGQRHIFLRLAGCNLKCAYCDQPEAQTIPATARVERRPGRRDFETVSNPIPSDVAARAVLHLHQPKRLHHALALTGGEPLVQADFLGTFLPLVAESGLKIFLETNGTRCDQLRRLLPWIDIVSMDFKLKSSTGRPTPLAAHERFLRLAARHSVQVFVKVVVAARTTSRELIRAAKVIAGVKRSLPVVLQPVTSGMRGPAAPTPEQVLALQEAVARYVDNVRVIPQTHKMTGQL